MDSESLYPITQVKPYLWIFSFASIAKLPNTVRVLVFHVFANICQF